MPHIRRAGPRMPGPRSVSNSGASPLTLVELPALLREPERRIHAGVQRADQLAPAGRYVRSAPKLYNFDDGHPVNARIRAGMAQPEQDYPPLHHVVLRDAMVTGQGTVITRDSILIHDSCWEFFNHKLVPIGLHRQDDTTLVLETAPTRRITRPSLLVKRPWWRNYGHWLLDSATLLSLIPGIRLPSDWQIVIGRPEPGMRDVVEQTLATLAPGVPIIEHRDDETWVFDELHYTSPVSRPGTFKLPQALVALRTQFLGAACPSSPGKKLYVTRGNTDRRRLLNEDAIAALCVARGFEVVRPEELSVTEQARLFHTADIIVGVKGAALTNLLFCTSAAAVVVLSPLGWMDVLFWDLAGQIGMDYVEIIGPVDEASGSPSHQPFTIDPSLLSQALDDLDATHEWQRPVHSSRIEPETPPPQTIVPTPPRMPRSTIEVFAHFQDEGDVTVAVNEPLHGAVSNHAIEGFGIRPSPNTPSAEIEYRGVVGKNWLTPWVQGGAYCGTRGWRLPLFGFAVRLHGRTARQFLCTYDASFADGSVLHSISDGQDCVSETMAPLTSLTIRLQRRPKVSRVQAVSQDEGRV